MSFSSSIRLPAYSKQLKCHSVHERGRNRGRGKENKSRENQHVTSETLSTQKSQVMPRSDQNNNRSAGTWIVSPTHKLPPPHDLFLKNTLYACAAVKSWLFAALAAFVFLHNSLFPPDHKPKHQLTLSVYQQSFDELGSLLGEFVTADFKNESYCETFPPQKKKGGGMNICYKYILISV